MTGHSREGRRRAWPLACGFGALVLLGACGGESRRASPTGPEAAAGSGSGSQPDEEAVPPVINPLPDCVPAENGGDDDAACPAPRIDIGSPINGPVCAPGGFTIEPLQVPDFSSGVLADPQNPPYTEPDPAKWDRSALPAGAYVFRVHGLRASCYPHGGRFYANHCSDSVQILPGSYYERHCSEAPGCSTSEKLAFSNSPDGYDVSGYWWYLNDRGVAALDVVVCAPEVVSYEYGGCLALNPKLKCGEI